MDSEMPYSGRAATTIDQFAKPIISNNEGTCPNDEQWCGGPDGDDIPCFECYDPDQDYAMGSSP
jgi:hypothetical protein